jgi:2,3-bisphosphoglycerate-dependent phosphoglycerate mutase
MEPTEVIVVRHGETTWNLEGRRQGHLDSPLTPKGIAQAEALAQRLKGEHFGALYSSDLGRACQTAEIIASATGHGIAVDGRLRERNLGIFQGLRSDEIQKFYPEEYRLHRTSGPDFVIPGGESARQQVERNIRCLEELTQQHPGQRIAVVTHGGVLSGLFRHTFSIPLDAPRRFEFLNCSINVFTYEQNLWMLQTWGDVSHLNSAP